MLRRSRGAALFRGLRPSSSPGVPFWPLGLTLRSSRPAYGGRLTLAVRRLEIRFRPKGQFRRNTGISLVRMENVMMHEHEVNALATTWVEMPDVNDVEPRNANDEVVFREVREVLQRHGALQRFGLTLNHRHFDLQPGEVIFESTDTENRRQIIEPRKADEVLGGSRVLETQWMFDRPDGTVLCVGFCNYNNGHKHIHNRQ